MFEHQVKPRDNTPKVIAGARVAALGAYLLWQIASNGTILMGPTER